MFETSVDNFCGASSKEKGAHNSLFWPIADQLIMQLLCNNIDV